MRLDAVPTPYAVWIGVVSVLIFSAPNLLLLGTGALAEGGQTPTSTNPGEAAFALILTLVFQFVLFGLALLPVLAAGRPYRRIFGPTRPGPLVFAIGLGVGVAAAITAYTVNAILIGLFGSAEPVEQQLLQDSLAGGLTTFLVILIAVVAAPITEEIVFRGVLFRSFAGRTGVHVAALLSSAVFAGIHFEVLFSQPLALAGLFVIGLALAYAFHHTGSLVVPIDGHAVFNWISVALALLFESMGLDQYTEVAALLAPFAAVVVPG